jgi:N-acetyl-gamma-glutamyl-phosphate reductase
MIRVGIAGATGYTGLELLRICAHHPEVEVIWTTSDSYPGVELNHYCPAWRGRTCMTFEKPEMEKMARQVDMVFLGLPHGVSMDYVPTILPHAKIVDLGADFRIKNIGVYEKAYGLQHKIPSVVAEAVYGIPEIYRNEIQRAQIVANPGCFPTSIIIPLYPLLRERVIHPEVIADSKSGVTGAGKKPNEATHFCEVDENFKAYKIGEHRHHPEIQEQLSFAFGDQVDLVFTPHLLPLKRGILSTIYVQVDKSFSESDGFALWQKYYEREPWVRIYPAGTFPELKWVLGSNYCDIGMKKVDDRHLIIVSAIDNLTKGASGQAIQNMNIMFGIDERVGLPDSVLYP